MTTENKEEVTLSNGGVVSRTGYYFLDFDSRVLLDVAKISKSGYDRRGPDNYKRVTYLEHVDRALAHIHLFLAGDTSDNHLGNAICRLIFAYSNYLSEKGWSR